MNEVEVDNACKKMIIPHPEVKYCGSLMSESKSKLIV